MSDPVCEWPPADVC